MITLVPLLATFALLYFLIGYAAITISIPFDFIFMQKGEFIEGTSELLTNNILINGVLDLIKWLTMHNKGV